MSFSRNAAFERGFSGFQFAGAARPYDDPAARRAALDRLDMLATVFDTAFILPGTNVRFGVESLLRLVPGIGDAIASALSCYLLYEAHRLGVGTRLAAGAQQRPAAGRNEPRAPAAHRAQAARPSLGVRL